jgi:GNAT superfamily N-acetyltransferase
MTIWVRLGAPSDLDALASVDANAQADPLRLPFIKAALAAGECRVAGRGEAPEGLLVIKRQHFFGRDFVELVAVAPDARRAGVASALMHTAAEAAEGEQLFTSTNESNAPMRALLAKLGYLQAGQVDHLDPGDPELIFVKYLDQ